MSHPNKIRGNGAEYFIRDHLESKGIPCQRAFGSDGRAMGLDAEDDLRVGWFRAQVKRFKFQNVVKWFVENAINYLHGKQHIVFFYVDRSKGHPRTVYTILDLETFSDLMRMAMLYGKTEDDRRSS